MVKKVFVAISVFCAVCVQWGCTAGRKLHYHDITLDLAYTGSRTIDVAVHDQRPYVKSGRKDPDYAGSVRRSYAIPYNMWTESGHPLAEDFRDSICDSLDKKGYTTIAATVTPDDSPEQAWKKLIAGYGDRFIMVTIDEWYSDSWGWVNLYYDITLKVLARGGAMLAGIRLKGQESVGYSFWNSLQVAYDNLPVAFKEKFEILLNDKDIKEALK